MTKLKSFKCSFGLTNDRNNLHKWIQYIIQRNIKSDYFTL